MNKLIITALCICGFIQIHAQEIEKKSIKHELARMPEQASWTVERWNINDVDFEIKEVSKETRNQLAQFQLKLKIPSQNKKAFKSLADFNPLAEKLGYSRKSLDVTKNKILYYTEDKTSFSITKYWNIGELQLCYLEDSNLIKRISFNNMDYQNYAVSDFPLVNHLLDRDLFKGEILFESKRYLFYQGDIDISRKNKRFASIESKIKNDEADNEAYLNSIKLGYSYDSFLLLDKNTLLPAYHCDALIVYKYIYPEETQVFSMPEVPEVVKGGISWYIENVLPEMERRAQKAAN